MASTRGKIRKGSTSKTQADFMAEISVLMTPERQDELEAFIKTIPPVFKQFLFRYMELRDFAVVGSVKDMLLKDESVSTKFSDKVYVKLAKVIKPWHTTLDKIVRQENKILKTVDKLDRRQGRLEEKVRSEERLISDLKERLDAKRAILAEHGNCLEQHGKAIALLQPENIKMLQDKIIDLTPVLDDIQKLSPVFKRFTNALKWYKIVFYIIGLIGVLVVFHLIF